MTMLEEKYVYIRDLGIVAPKKNYESDYSQEVKLVKNVNYWGPPLRN